MEYYILEVVAESLKRNFRGQYRRFVFRIFTIILLTVVLFLISLSRLQEASWAKNIKLFMAFGCAAFSVVAILILPLSIWRRKESS
jgi:predicted membrane protein